MSRNQNDRIEPTHPHNTHLENFDYALFFRCVVDVICQNCNVTPKVLLNKKRCKAPVCDARQLAMYLLNTNGDFSYSAVGKWMQRDRTTVGHACRKVEDRRDEPIFNDGVVLLERHLEATVLENGLYMPKMRGSVK